MIVIFSLISCFLLVFFLLFLCLLNIQPLRFLVFVSFMIFIESIVVLLNFWWSPQIELRLRSMREREAAVDRLTIPYKVLLLVLHWFVFHEDSKWRAKITTEQRNKQLLAIVLSYCLRMNRCLVVSNLKYNDLVLKLANFRHS